MPWMVQIFNKYYKYLNYKIDDIIEQIEPIHY